MLSSAKDIAGQSAKLKAPIKLSIVCVGLSSLGEIEVIVNLEQTISAVDEFLWLDTKDQKETF